MLRFVVRRLLLLIPILIGLSILVFIWIRALPGSPAEALLGEHSTPEAAARLRHQYGLDQPVYAQYWAYLKTIASGNLGTSIASTRTVTYELEHRFPATIELALAAMIFAISLGIPLGFMGIAAQIARGLMSSEIGGIVVATFVGAAVGEALDGLFSGLTARVRGRKFGSVARTLSPVVLTALPTYGPLVAVLVLAYVEVSP